MTDFLEASVFFGLFLSFLSYGAGVYLKRKFKLSIFNPLLISIILTILVLVIFRVDYEVYYEKALDSRSEEHPSDLQSLMPI